VAMLAALASVVPTFPSLLLLTQQPVLREAASSSVTVGSTVALEAAVASADVVAIDVLPGRYALLRPLQIERSLTIRSSSPEAVVVLDGGQRVRPLQINTSGTVEVLGLQIAFGSSTECGGGARIDQGVVTFRSCEFFQCRAQSGGGACIAGGLVSFHNCTVHGCRAELAGGAFDTYSGSLDLDDCRVYDNTAALAGAAYFDGGLDGPQVSLKRTRVYRNRSPSGAGGLHLKSGTLTMFSCTLEENEGREGGGLLVDGGVVTLDGVRLAGNRALQGGGGAALRGGMATLANSNVRANAARFGAGLLVLRSSLRLSHCEIQENTAGVAGGGLYASSPAADATVLDCVFSGNNVFDIAISDGGRVAVLDGKSALGRIYGALVPVSGG